ncbi:hypothetical protein BH23GEM9_BH23GEM9_06390 [soil metagenome]
MKSRYVAGFTLVSALLGGCREPDGPGGPIRGGTRMLVSSDPQGATITLDQRDTGLRTPDTIGGLGGTHVLNVQLDSAGVRYSYSVQIAVSRVDSVLRNHGPLTRQCTATELGQCYSQMHRYHEAAGVRFATNPLGGLFMRQAQGQGLFWPATSSNSYISGSTPVIAGRLEGVGVSLGIYDHHFHAGRPAPTTSNVNGMFRLNQETWIVPPAGALRRFPTARGVSVRQELLASDDVEGVVLIRLTFRNITDQLDYQFMDSFLGAAGGTYRETYIGLLLDADIGDSGDDWLTYDPELDMVYAYDARFSEPTFTGNASAAPGLVGLRALRAPAGSMVVLNGWMSTGVSADWRAGQPSESFGYDMLSGLNPFTPAHPNRRIGHLPPQAADARIAVMAGPLTLAPGDAAEIVLAVAVAAPVAGTFQTGVLVQPGEPLDTQRDIHRIAATLRQRMRAAEALLDN